MKKTLVIITSLIFIASIVIVNFFGMEIRVFDGVRYVDYIQISYVELRDESRLHIEPKFYDMPGYEGKPCYEFKFVPRADGMSYDEDDENPNGVFVKYEIFPHDADEKSIEYLFDRDAIANKVIFNESKSTFVFLQPGVEFEVTIRSKDGSSASTSFILYCE